MTNIKFISKFAIYNNTNTQYSIEAPAILSILASSLKRTWLSQHTASKMHDEVLVYHLSDTCW